MPLPEGFRAETVVGGLNYPAAFDILPNGDILIGENSGLVRLYRNGQLQSTPFIDLRPIVNDWWDRGLISLRAAPDFEQTGHVYFYFTYEHDPSNFTGPKTARLIRVNSNGTTATLSGHQVIVGSAIGDSCNSLPEDADCIPTNAPGHSAGDIQFATDGTIFLTVGDGADWNVAHQDALRAQNLDVLGGKLLRITPNGQGLPSNPFWDGDPDSNRSKIWARGLRNAYRMDLHPDTGIPFAGDVGWNSWEEINVALSGVNLGWPCYEGTGQQSSYSSFQQCQNLYNQGASAVTPPLVQYSHAAGGAAVTAGVFYAHDRFPEEYHGAFFYSDYVRGFINYVHIDQSLNLAGQPQSLTTSAGSPVDFELAPDGSLYYLSIHEGELRRITYGDDPPVDPPEGDIVFLSDLPFTVEVNGWGPVQRDHSNGELESHGGPITIDGSTYEKGLGVHAFSEVGFHLGGACFSFRSDIGLPDYLDSQGSVTFEVRVDGQTAFQSGTMTGNSAAQAVDIAVDGASELLLLVGDAGDGVTADHANWADARLICSEEDEDDDPPVDPPPGEEIVYLSDLEWVSATNGWGTVERDHSNGEQDSHGGPITIDGTVYEKGLGVHAFSEIVFALDGSCTTFLSDIGLPDYLEDNGSVTFEVLVDGNSQFLSEVMTGSSHALAIEVNITGASELRLLVGDGGNGINYDHANWADARLLCESDSEPPVDPPVTTISSPSASDLFKVGDTVEFEGEATDHEGQSIPASELTWRVRIHHCNEIDCHIHQMLNPTGVDSGSFIVPDHGDTFYFEFILTAEDDNGLIGTDILELHPFAIEVTIETEPAGLDTALGGVTGPSPLTRTLVANSENTIFVPSPQQDHEFVEWEHGGPQNQNVTVDDEDVTFTAIFEEIEPPDDPPDDPPPGAEVVYLSDLEWVSATNGWGPVERDHSIGEQETHGGSITIGGTIYEKGLGVHAFSEIVFALDGSCSTFLSDIGLPDYLDGRGTVTFEVRVDGQSAFQSGTMRGSDPAESVEIDISGASELRLLVGDAGDGINSDHANWADARLLCSDDSPTDPPPGDGDDNGDDFSTDPPPGDGNDNGDDSSTDPPPGDGDDNGDDSSTDPPPGDGDDNVDDFPSDPPPDDGDDGDDASTPPGEEIVYLSDLDWVSATNGWGSVQRDRSNGEQDSDGGPITIAGTTYEKGLGVHAFSEIVFALDGSCSTFVSDIGLPDYLDGQGTVTFEVRVDGQIAFQSDTKRGNDPAETVEIDISDASELRLLVGDAGDGINTDHANWADARLLCGDDTRSSSSQFAALLGIGVVSGLAVGVRNRPRRPFHLA